MNTVNANSDAARYQLKSELARACLDTPRVHGRRRLAWTNSVCILYLFVGIAGFRPSPPAPILVKPLQEPVPVVIEPLPPPPAPPAAEIKPEEQPKDSDKPAVPNLVLVTPDSPAINFAVPTPGGIVVPFIQAMAPPAEAAPQRVVAAPAPAPSTLKSTGEGGDRPLPPYPKMAQDLAQQGTVVLLLTADEAGIITAAEVKESSGSSILDHASVEHVKKHWTVLPGPRGRLFLAPISYTLK
jgi:TonB family protein